MSLFEKIRKTVDNPTNHLGITKNMARPYPIKDVNCKYGAPMGRRCENLSNIKDRVNLQKVPIDGGGYDQGGAYWDHGQQLWVCWGHEPEEQGGYMMETYIRADTRDQAKTMLLEDFPNLKFYR